MQLSGCYPGLLQQFPPSGLFDRFIQFLRAARKCPGPHVRWLTAPYQKHV